MINDFFLALSNSISNGLFIDEILHGVVTLPFAAYIYYKTKSVKYSLIPLAVTYLMDMDHWIDYFLYYGLNLSLVRFVSGEYFDATQRAIVPLHAWEWLLGIIALALENKKWKSVYVAVALGMLAHLLWDSHTVGSLAFYSILNRISHGFIMIR